VFGYVISFSPLGEKAGMRGMLSDCPLTPTLSLEGEGAHKCRLQGFECETI